MPVHTTEAMSDILQRVYRDCPFSQIKHLNLVISCGNDVIVMTTATIVSARVRLDTCITFGHTPPKAKAI